MKDGLTEIVLIIDRSGSMNNILSDAQGGYDNFIEDQKKEQGEVNVTLAQFDDIYELVFENQNINTIPAYKIVPRNMTALLDAIGKTINNVGTRLANTKEEDRPSKVMVCIITDGQENSSSEFNKTQIKEMIEHQTSKYSWQFVFIGANIDAFGEAGSMGIKYAASYDSTSKGIRSAFFYASDVTKKLRNSVTLDAFDKSVVKNVKLDS